MRTHLMQSLRTGDTLHIGGGASILAFKVIEGRTVGLKIAGGHRVELAWMRAGEHVDFGDITIRVKSVEYGRCLLRIEAPVGLRIRRQKREEAANEGQSEQCGYRAPDTPPIGLGGGLAPREDRAS